MTQPELEPSSEPAAEPAARPMTEPAARTPRWRRLSRPTRRQIGRGALHLVAIGTGAVVAGLLIHFGFMPLAVGHGRDIVVPDVSGLDREDAIRTLADEGLAAKVVAERVDLHSAPGTILDQDPPAGFRTREGRAVGLTASLGRGEVLVPPVTGESLRHTELMLTREGLPIGFVSRRYDSTDEELVIATSPPANEPVQRGRPINVLVSAGQQPEAFMMPDFTGADPNTVSRALRRAGFPAEVEYPADSRADARVVAQEPEPGHRIVAGDRIKLIVGDRNDRRADEKGRVLDAPRRRPRGRSIDSGR